MVRIAQLCEYTEKRTELCTLEGWTLHYVNYIAVKLFLKWLAIKQEQLHVRGGNLLEGCMQPLSRTRDMGRCCPHGHQLSFHSMGSWTWEILNTHGLRNQGVLAIAPSSLTEAGISDTNLFFPKWTSLSFSLNHFARIQVVIVKKLSISANLLVIPLCSKFSLSPCGSC